MLGGRTKPGRTVGTSCNAWLLSTYPTRIIEGSANAVGRLRGSEAVLRKLKASKGPFIVLKQLAAPDANEPSC